MILLVGYPGSGKSHFSRQHSTKSKYSVVNRDALGSWQKCASTVEKALDDGKSVIVDNTNPDCESRSRFLKIATTRRVPCRCFVMNSSLSHAQHNNKVSRTGFNYRLLSSNSARAIPGVQFLLSAPQTSAIAYLNLFLSNPSTDFHHFLCSLGS